MRQQLGEKKVRHYRRLTGLDVIAGLVRGGTGHRVDLCVRDGSVWMWHRGEVMKWCGLTHDMPSVLREDKELGP